jgi:hypothetical protein
MRPILALISIVGQGTDSESLPSCRASILKGGNSAVFVANVVCFLPDSRVS